MPSLRGKLRFVLRATVGSVAMLVAMLVAPAANAHWMPHGGGEAHEPNGAETRLSEPNSPHERAEAPGADDCGCHDAADAVCGADCSGCDDCDLCDAELGPHAHPVGLASDGCPVTAGTGLRELAPPPHDPAAHPTPDAPFVPPRS